MSFFGLRGGRGAIAVFLPLQAMFVPSNKKPALTAGAWLDSVKACGDLRCIKAFCRGRWLA